MAETSHPDPDAHGLPPGAVLPDAKIYRRSQLRAILITNAAAFGVVLVWWLLDRKSWTTTIAFVTLAVTLVISFVRWVISR
ncbi:MAG: hypothetical protein IT444_03940 [Phycisphaeraceae bacterium]|nr:hypothetical protein [Phycisphaeraceae bacterium]